ncbi:MAG: PIN domain-containing protein [Methylacidiphilales bacterium]|nr:PIN domain-containing protein [Candidatus Methylacidiphilales bacterium]
MIYCDTSFLLALYVERDFFHFQASRLAAKFKEPIPLTLLSELELVNGIRRCLAAKIILMEEHDAIFRQIAEDESQGILARHAIHQADHFAKARELSKRFTPELSARSLDILHVAAALLLKAIDFGSFDEKQRVLARKAGLKLAPVFVTKQRRPPSGTAALS